MKQNVPREMPCSIQQAEIDQILLETQEHLNQRSAPSSLRIQLAEPSAQDHVKSLTRKSTDKQINLNADLTYAIF